MKWLVIGKSYKLAFACSGMARKVHTRVKRRHGIRTHNDGRKALKGKKPAKL